MKLWIARDSDNELYIYNGKPTRKKEYFNSPSIGDYFRVDDNLFPEVTWENSPQKVELKLL